MIEREYWTDNELMKLMDLRENQELSFGAIAKIMERSRNSISGQYGRIVRDLNASEEQTND